MADNRDKFIADYPAPEGATWSKEPVKEAGYELDICLLVWQDLEKATQYYGADALVGLLDGTSLRVNFQGIARRAKSIPEAMAQQLAYRPGRKMKTERFPYSDGFGEWFKTKVEAQASGRAKAIDAALAEMEEVKA